MYHFNASYELILKAIRILYGVKETFWVVYKFSNLTF